MTSAELNRRELERYLERVTDRWPIQRALLGGARVDDHNGAPAQRERGSEYVLVLVSEHFDGIPWLERVYQAGSLWDALEMGAPADVHCYTPRRVRAQARAAADRARDRRARPRAAARAGLAPLSVRERVSRVEGSARAADESVMSRLSRLLTTFALLVAVAALTAGPALARDRDHDRLPDKWEKRHHLNLKKDDSRRDRDRDGLSNYGEYRAHTNPRKKDSDRDGRRDGREDYDRDKLRNGAEIRTGFDPGDKDSDNDGVKDGRENAGKIVKLSASSITIKLAVGGSLTARLGDEPRRERARAGRNSGSTPGSDPDVPEPGEDAPEPGEDEEPGEPGDERRATPATRDDAADAPRRRRRAARTTRTFDDASLRARARRRHGRRRRHCGTATLKVGAIVHKAKVTRGGSGQLLVAIELVRRRSSGDALADRDHPLDRRAGALGDLRRRPSPPACPRAARRAASAA